MSSAHSPEHTIQKPIIGVTAYRTPSKWSFSFISSAEAYVQALVRAGAIPILIPLGLPEPDLKRMRDVVDGVLFTGGGDIDPQLYGDTMHPTMYRVDLERDQMEIYLVKEVIGEKIPFLGICRGMQVINVALGGTLYTDIAAQHEDALQHSLLDEQPWDYLAHPAQIREESRLAKIMECPILEVNSLHHQAVKEIAPGLVPTAHAPDGIIEAFELPDHPYGLAVQWHPECLMEHGTMRALFKSFVQAAVDGKK